MRAATLEIRLEKLGVLKPFCRSRVSNDNYYSESLFRTAIYSPIIRANHPEIKTILAIGSHRLLIDTTTNTLTAESNA